MWCIELASCQEENARSIELTNYLKEQLGETSDLWTLADFLMKKGEFDKAENYYTKLENELNLPEKHADRAEIYNRLGLIRREQNELRLAAEYFEKAIKAAPPHNDIEATAKYNLKISEEDRKRKPLSFLGKRIGSSDITIKSLAANHASIPLVENNLGNVAWHEGNYNLAFMHYQTAVSAMAESKLTYLREISCVYNNLGAVAYSKEDYSGAKDYFEKAIFTLQQLNRRHPWIAEYIENLAYAQRKIVMKRPLTNIHGTIF
ncbi:unnamed protein product [Adineta steineri]|uniref:Tetratricopeptide repeat protein n=1 Tax=Adineta steineri TaxID=433720 RepID=A0A813QSX2_9BILA|nr:unnamed protein product [Adineta steineri]CAF1471258.1 unnamed protein product [Adineta steineri]